MGNTNRRPSASTRTSQPSAQWDEASVLRLISENKLAPKYIEKQATSSKECVECPICFLEFTIINTVHCCKQYICTECVVQIKGTEGKGACPFCGNTEMHVSLIPLPKKTHSHVAATPSKGSKDERVSLSSEGDQPPSSRSSGSGAASLSYTTPEQEKKLRSYSLDATAGSSSGGSAVATKMDREALERQIREQRLQFDERDLAHEAERSNRSAGYYRNGNRNATGSGAATGGITAAFLRGRYRMAGSPGSAEPGSPSGATQRMASSAPERSPIGRYMTGIEGMLQSRGGIGGITSLQQLEDIMLMEAIRLSMQDVPADPSNPTASSTDDTRASPTPQNNNNATFGTTGVGSQTTTALNSSTGSAQTSPYTTQTAAVTSSTMTTAGVGAGTGASAGAGASVGTRRMVPEYLVQRRNVYRSSSDSTDSDDGPAQVATRYAYDDEGGEQEYRASGTSDGLYAAEEGSRGSDVLSEEDEQLRIAMALSLSTLRAEQNKGGAAEVEGDLGTRINAAIMTRGTEAGSKEAAGASDNVAGGVYNAGVLNATAPPDMVESEHTTEEVPERSATVAGLFDAFCLFAHQPGSASSSTNCRLEGSPTEKGSEGPVMKMPAGNNTTVTEDSSL